MYLWQSFSRFWEFTDLVVFFIALIGLFAFSWEKIIFPKLFWKAYFFIHIVWNIFYLYILPLPEKIIETMEVSQFYISTISVVFYIPLFFALYYYAFQPSMSEPPQKRL